MASRLVQIGDFSFKHRGLLLPIAVLLLLIPSPRLVANPAAIGVIGLMVALVGQIMRIGTIGLAYIIRGGKDHHVYAEELVTSGLYSHCRNPMYVGNFFLLVGFALASNSWVFVLAGVPISLLMHRAIIAAEENFLRGKFGAQFDAYCQRVPRWVPRLAGLAATFKGMQFDWRRVLEKEYMGPFDWLSAIAVVVIVNIWRAGLMDEQRGVVILMVFVLVARLAAWSVSRAIKQRELTVVK